MTSIQNTRGIRGYIKIIVQSLKGETLITQRLALPKVSLCLLYP